MFSFNKKLEPNLKDCIKANPYNNYRILIKYKRFQDNIMKKVTSYKGKVINHIEPCLLISAYLNSKGINRLLEFPEVEYICFDEYLFLCGISVTTANKAKLNNKNIKNKGRGIGVAIIDSGVYPHQDLINPYNRIASFIDLINNYKFPYDDNGHGTSIAGIIAANGNKSNGLYTGIAPESKIYSYKAFDQSGKGYISDILYAMKLILNEGDKGNVKVLCMPFELLKYNSFIQNMFNKMVSLVNSKNITCVLPSGSNINADGSLTGIALNNNCITVSGYDSNSNIKPYLYSSAGPAKKSTKPNLCAACVNIVSLNSDTNYISEREGMKLYPSKLDTSYNTFTGTSLAAAFVSGVCALIYSDNESLTPKDVASLLKVSCEPLDMPQNYQGDGIINIKSIIK